MKDEKKPSDIAFNSPLLKGRVDALDISPEMDSPLEKPTGSAFSRKSKATKLINPIRCEKKKDSQPENDEEFKKETEK